MCRKRRNRGKVQPSRRAKRKVEDEDEELSELNVVHSDSEYDSATDSEEEYKPTDADGDKDVDADGDKHARDKDEDAHEKGAVADGDKKSKNQIEEIPTWQLAFLLHQNKRIRSYTGKKLPQVGQCVFEYDPKSDLKKGSNPGFGPAAGVITSLDNCDVGVRWFDSEKEEAMNLTEIRQAPQIGEIVKNFYPTADGKIMKYENHSVFIKMLKDPDSDDDDGHVLTHWAKCR